MMKPTFLVVVAMLSLALAANAGDRLAQLATAGDEPFPTLSSGPASRSLFKNWAAYARGEIPIRKSMSLNYGLSYDPNSDTDLLLAGFQWTCKYEDFWIHDTPDSLMLRFELAGGARLRQEARGVLSCGMFAQWYFRSLANDRFKPYVDAGIGVIYTDFQNEDQGLRVNFNPRLSVGTDFKMGDSTYFAAIRLFHVSNADIHEDNRGINGAMIVFGKYF